MVCLWQRVEICDGVCCGLCLLGVEVCDGVCCGFCCEGEEVEVCCGVFVVSLFLPPFFLVYWLCVCVGVAMGMVGVFASLDTQGEGGDSRCVLGV